MSRFGAISARSLCFGGRALKKFLAITAIALTGATGAHATSIYTTSGSGDLVSNGFTYQVYEEDGIQMTVTAGLFDDALRGKIGLFQRRSAMTHDINRLQRPGGMLGKQYLQVSLISENRLNHAVMQHGSDHFSRPREPCAGS